VACRHRRGYRRLHCNSSSLRRWRRWNRRSRRRLGNNWAWRRRNLCGLREWNGRRLWNNWRRSRRREFCFDGARRGSRRAARRWNNGRGVRRDHGRRRRRSYHGGLHTSRSGRGFLRCLIRYRFLFRRGFFISERAKVFAHLYRSFYFNRAGMRFFLGDSGFRQIVDDRLRLDLEFASQFVDSDLIRIGHCPPGPLLLSVLF
jgi:hypothetical protein